MTAARAPVRCLSAALAGWLAVAAGGADPAAPAYVVIRRETTIAVPPDRVWSRIGEYCAIIRILDASCRYASGSGDVGTVRSLRDGATLEPMVARTSHSYTYAQTVGAYAADHYHGTMAVEPGAAGATRLIYTITFDGSAMTPQALAARRTGIDDRARFVVEKIRTTVEAEPAGGARHG